MATAIVPAKISIGHRPRNRSSRPRLSLASSVRCSSAAKTPIVTTASASIPAPSQHSLLLPSPTSVLDLTSSAALSVAASGIPSLCPSTLQLPRAPSQSLTFPDALPPQSSAEIPAGTAAMRMLGIRSVGLCLSLYKGLPLGSGLSSSAASAAAAGLAVSELFSGRLSPDELVLAGLESEKKVSGYHADNVGPSILEGFGLIRSYDPFEIIQLEFPADKDFFFVLVSPEFEAPTKEMWEALPANIPMKKHVQNSSQLAAALVAAVMQGNVRLLGSAMAADRIVKPRRAPLIPGMVNVKKAAMEAGAFGCTISGAGPTAVAVIDDEEKGNEISSRMVEAFLRERNLLASATVAKLDRVGARITVSSVE